MRLLSAVLVHPNMRAVLLLLVPAIAHAQPPDPAPAFAPESESEPITLADAVRAAVLRNPGLLATRVDAAIADAKLTSARGALDLVASTSAKWHHTRPRAIDEDPASTTVTTSSALTQPLPTGGSVALTADTEFSRQRLVLDGTSSRTDSNSADVLLVLRHPLLRGWGDGTAPRISIARTEISRDIARLEAAASAATTLRDLVVAYWELAFARDDVAIRRRSLSVAKEQQRITRARVATGKIASSELLAVGQAIALREDELARSEAALVTRSLELARLLGRDINDAHTFDPIDRRPPSSSRSSSPPSPAPDRDIQVEIAAALARSPELATLRARGKAAVLEVEVANNAMLPAVDVTASVGVHGSGQDSSTAWQELTHAATPVFGASVEVTFPIANRAASGTRAAARRTVKRVKLDEQALAAELRRGVVDAATAMHAAHRRIAALDDAVDLAEQAIEAERARWEAGKSTNYEVMRRQAEREDTALRRARAQADLLEAEAMLDALTGAILPRYHVRFSG